MIVTTRRYHAGCWTCDGSTKTIATFKDIGTFVLAAIRTGPEWEHDSPIAINNVNPAELPTLTFSGSCRERPNGSIRFNGESGKILKTWRLKRDVNHWDSWVVLDESDTVLSASEQQEQLKLADLFIDDVEAKPDIEDVLVVGDGKYTFTDTGSGLKIDRYGEPWVFKHELLDIPGANAFYALYFKAKELLAERNELAKALNEARTPNV